jgi:mono/diheme cytochrome c family protein
MTWRAWWIAAAACALGACERGMHDMYDQPKYKPLTPSKLFDDGNSSRPQVAGTVPHSGGALAGSSSGRNDPIKALPPAGAAIGVDVQGRSLALDETAENGYANPLPITLPLVARGRDRYDVYCAPCHSRTGEGDGMIVRRGFPAPPSYHSERLRNAPDSHFFQVISNGYGVMYPYADRITAEDRWAIVAYIRALQLSQHAPAAQLDAQDVAALSDRAP